MPIAHENLAIAVDDEQIAATLITDQPRKVAGLLFVHGWGASKEENLAEATSAAQLGCACLIFDLRGHALTAHLQKTVSREQNLRDVIAAYDTLVSRGQLDAAHLGIVGVSYGGYLAAIATLERPTSQLALRAPAIYRDADWHRSKLRLHDDPELLVYRRRTVPPSDNRALRACAAFRGDVLMVESEHDTIVPAPVIKSYLGAFTRAHSISHRIISDADHGLTEERHRCGYKELLMSWIRDTMIGSTEEN